MPRRPTGNPNGRPPGSNKNLSKDPDQRLLAAADRMLKRWEIKRRVWRFLAEGDMCAGRRELDVEDIDELRNWLIKHSTDRIGRDDALMMERDRKRRALKRLEAKRDAKAKLDNYDGTFGDMEGDPKMRKIFSVAVMRVSISEPRSRLGARAKTIKGRMESLRQKYIKYSANPDARSELHRIAENLANQPAKFIFRPPEIE